jgi:outer membrane biosynthesis protein TonB
MNSYLTLMKPFCGRAFFVFAWLVIGPVVLSAQDRAPKVVSQPIFKLSDEALAAGIDGVLGVSLKIDKEGIVKNVVIHGGPAWPCGSPAPKDQIESVREAVKKQLLATVFEPSQKDGKAREAELSLQFAVGEAYKSAVREEEAKNRPVAGAKLVEAGVIQGRAIRLAKPARPSMPGIVVVRVQVDEQGNVAHAGAINGHPQLQDLARTAACESKFSPTVLSGQPVKVTGMITYAMSR